MHDFFFNLVNQNWHFSQFTVKNPSMTCKNFHLLVGRSQNHSLEFTYLFDWIENWQTATKQNKWIKISQHNWIPTNDSSMTEVSKNKIFCRMVNKDIVATTIHKAKIDRCMNDFPVFGSLSLHNAKECQSGWWKTDRLDPIAVHNDFFQSGAWNSPWMQRKYFVCCLGLQTDDDGNDDWLW